MTKDQIIALAETHGSKEHLGLSFSFDQLEEFAAALAAAKAHPEAAQAEPAPSPDSTQVPTEALPYDVTIGGNTFRKGVSLSTFVKAAQSWHRAAYPDGYTLTEEQKAANLARLQSVGVAQPVGSALTDEQIERHKLRAGDCPPNSEVLLVSGVKRLQAKNLSTPPAERAQGEPVAQPCIYADLCNIEGTCTNGCQNRAAHPQGANEPAEDAAHAKRWKWLKMFSSIGEQRQIMSTEWGAWDAYADKCIAEAERKSAAAL